VTGAESTLWWHHLPVVNASLNGLSATLLVTAFVMIKSNRPKIHAGLMISAFVASSVFLACYLIFHTLKKIHGEGLTPFPASPWRPWYLGILLSHTLLAIAILPLIFTSFWLAWKRNWKRHHQVSRFTFPLWLYVSVTGVVVYFMLYQLAPTLR